MPNTVVNAKSNELDTRWAYTALDVKNRAYAVPDEIMIDKNNGRIWYKREDGQVVSYTPEVQDSGLNEFALAVSYAESAAQYEIQFPTTSGAVLANIDYPAVDVFGDGSLSEITIESPTAISKISAKSSLTSNTIFVKIKTRETDADYVSLLSAMYNYQNNKTDRDNAEITYTITYANSIGLSVSKTVTSGIVLNEMTAIRVPLPTDDDIASVIASLGTVSTITVKVDSVSFSALKSVYNPKVQSQADPYKSVMNADGLIVITDLYLATFVDKTTDVPTLDVGSYAAFYGSLSIKDRVDNTGGMTPEEKETIDNITNTLTNTVEPKLTEQDTKISNLENTVQSLQTQIGSATSTIYKYTVPAEGDIPKGATYYQLFDVTGTGDGVNVTYTNMTTDINEIQKWFADLMNQTAGEATELRAGATEDPAESDMIYVEVPDSN